MDSYLTYCIFSILTENSIPSIGKKIVNLVLHNLQNFKLLKQFMFYNIYITKCFYPIAKLCNINLI